MFAKAVWIRIWTVCSSSELRLVQRELDHSACIVSLQSRSDALANSRSVWRVEEKFIAAELSKFCNRLTSRLVTPCQPAAEEHLSDATNGLNDIPSEATGPEEFQRPYDHNDLCDSNPEFSVICSFISKFGVNIDLKLNIERLKETIENQETLDDDLIEIHVKLLKKLRRYFNRDQWEKALIRFAYEYSHEDGYELESLGYLKTRPSIKLSLLRRLLDAQFECDPKFKASVNAIDADELRNQPTGRDIKGNIYWHCEDDEGNVRVYRDEPLNYAAWKTVCKNPDDLKTLLGELENSKGEIVKGEPQLEPYNPYPQIFSELFVNVEKTDTPPKKSVRKGRGRHKKSSPLHTLKELDENTIIQDTRSV